MPGAQVLELLASWLCTSGLTFFVILVDERRLSRARLERAWPPPSRNAAIIAFGVIALPVHFARTRGHFRSVRGAAGVVIGFALGVLAVFAVAVINGLFVGAIEWLLGIPPSE